MRYNKTKSGNPYCHVHPSRPKGKRDGHLCQVLTEKGNGTGGNLSISIANVGYSLALGVCLHLCSNPSSPFLILIPLNPSLPISSPLYTLIQSPLTFPLIYIFLLLCFPMCCLSLYRNKHTPELAPFAPSPPYITLMKALRFAYMNLSLSILRHINHITPSNYESRQIYL